MSDDNPMVCYCIQVKKDAIVEAIRDGAKDVAQVQLATRACTGCQSCYGDIEDIIDEVEKESK